MNNNNEPEWSKEIWDRIDRAVDEEAKRTKVAARFLPHYGPLADADDNVPADTIRVQSNTLTADRGATTALIEIGAAFSMTVQQVAADAKEHSATAITLATRATNLLSQAKDLIIFQGPNVKDGRGRLLPLLQRVTPEPTNASDKGLLGSINQSIEVEPIKDDQGNPIPGKYGENTFAKVAEAYSLLQAMGHYGPYALVLHADVYANALAPLANTLIMPADRIKALVGKEVLAGEDGERRHMFYGTGTLAPSTGLMMSLGGNTIDLASGNGVATTFQQKDADMYQFRVVERFAVRLKDKTALVRLDFK